MADLDLDLGFDEDMFRDLVGNDTPDTLDLDGFLNDLGLGEPESPPKKAAAPAPAPVLEPTSSSHHSARHQHSAAPVPAPIPVAEPDPLMELDPLQSIQEPPPEKRHRRRVVKRVASDNGAGADHSLQSQPSQPPIESSLPPQPQQSITEPPPAVQVPVPPPPQDSAQVAQLTALLDQAQAQVVALTAERDLLRRQLDTAQSEVASIRSQMQAMEAAGQNQAQVETLLAELRQLQDLFANQSEQMVETSRRLQQQTLEHQAELAELRGGVEEIDRREVALLQKERELARRERALQFEKASLDADRTRLASLEDTLTQQQADIRAEKIAAESIREEARRQRSQALDMQAQLEVDKNRLDSLRLEVSRTARVQASDWSATRADLTSSACTMGPYSRTHEATPGLAVTERPSSSTLTGIAAIIEQNQQVLTAQRQWLQSQLGVTPSRGISVTPSRGTQLSQRIQ